jgi:hypothetical protein
VRDKVSGFELNEQRLIIKKMTQRVALNESKNKPLSATDEWLMDSV